MLSLVVCAGCSFQASSATVIDSAVDVPADVAVPACGVASVAAGGDHTCAVLLDGTLACWGRAQSGELGIGTPTMKCDYQGTMYLCSTTPAPVGLTGVGAVALGSYHSCATTTAATSCWGANPYGAFGDGTATSSLTPVEIASRAGSTLIDAGRYHTCSVAAGMVACSGENIAGEIGNNTTGQQLTTVTAMNNVAAVALGDFISCVIDTQGQLWCWGRNAYKEIDASGQNRLVPTLVTGAAGALQVAEGLDHICVVQSDHTAVCWGSDTAGQLGDGRTASTAQPPVTAAVPSVAEVAADRDHTCVRDLTGGVWCFGDGYGVSPVSIALPAHAISIATGGSHDCAVTDDHSVWCWGNQDFGQLGNGVSSATRTLQPQQARVCE